MDLHCNQPAIMNQINLYTLHSITSLFWW